MKQDLLLTFTSSMQFGLFGAMAFIIFGWVDKKERFTDIGRLVFVALGIYSLWVLLSGQVQVPVLAEGNDIPREIRAIAFFKGVILCAGLSLFAFLLKLLKTRYYRFVTLVCIVFALFLFFTVYNLQQG